MLGESGDHRMPFQAGKPSPGAAMGTVAEGKVIRRVARDIEHVRVLVVALITVSRPKQDRDVRTFRNDGSFNLNSAGGASPPA